ncbi:MAG: translation initiation factor IF-2, partial [candidate division Zixibacteria bacterium]|nr:translation initiation factor IF-2 [candidate division Zixibacteria bacterium]
MAAKRIYQAAKENKISSEAMLNILRELGFKPKSHMSVFTDEMEVAVRKKFDEEKEAVKREIEQKKKIANVVAQKKEAAKKEGPSKKQVSKKQLQKLVKDGLSGPAKRRKPPKKKPQKREVDKKEVEASLKKTLTAMEGAKKGRHYHKRAAKQEIDAEDEKVIPVLEFMTVSELADRLNIKPNELVGKLMSLGVMATINQRLDMDTISMVALEYGFDVREEKEIELIEEEEEEDRPEDLEPRAPIVTIMGHVDHGKTSLLDYIRRSNITSGESGGITQHIGAYEVLLEGGRIVFVDTPGHEAFTAMRARGAQVTDIVVLVVAADDNVMPQTLEAIDHARAAGVPIIVAINKMDLPAANPDAVKTQLSKHNLLPEEWGGKTITVEISAKTGTGVDSLLEMILLQAEMMELKANPHRKATGVVVESELDKGRGPVINVIIRNGTLEVGDSFVTGPQCGRIRAMFNDRGEAVRAAEPATPVQLLGCSGLPQAGDTFTAVKDDVIAKDISQKRLRLKREQDIRKSKPLSLTDVYDRIQEGSIKNLNLIIKGDVDGSVEALSGTLQKLSTSEIKVNVIRSGVGAITESDILLASASQAVVIGFHVRPDARAKEVAAHEGVDVRLYRVIYEAEDDVRKALEGLLEPEIVEDVIGTVEVRDTFKVPKVGTIAGCFVQTGVAKRNAHVRLIRDGIVIYEGVVSSLKRFKEDVREVVAGYECGIGIENYNDIKVGDNLEIVEIKEVARKLDTEIN